jgi:hypothetical protein
VNNIFIEETTNGCLTTVSYSTSKQPVTVVINNSCLLWATNLYSYVRIMGISDVPHRKIQVPVQYRIVYAIPKNNSSTTGVDITNIAANGPILGDGLTTRLTFACTNVQDAGEMMNLNTPSWNVSCYTTDTDYANMNPGGSFVNPCQSGTPCCTAGYTLLVIEAVSLLNRRTISWDGIHLSVSVALNPSEIELAYYNEFIKIFIKVYQAYVGSNVLPEIPLTVEGDCGINNICQYSFPMQSSIDRETPQVLILRLLTSLYGGSTWPDANSNNNSPSCCGTMVQ